MQKRNNSLAILLILLFIFAVSAISWVSFETGLMISEHQVQADILNTVQTIDDFTLTDNKQRPFTLQNLKDRWSLLYFGYTNCPDICPTTLTKLKHVHDLLSNENPGLQIVFVSVDHERDTPEKLDVYLRDWNDDFVGVTGTSGDLEKFTGNLGVDVNKVPGPAGDIHADDYLLEHTSSLLLVSPQMKVTAIFNSPHRVTNLYNDIILIIER